MLASKSLGAFVIGFTLTGCGGGTGGSGNILGLGGEPGVLPNGQGEAGPDDSLPDLSGSALEVVLPRFVADYGTGETSIEVTSELVELGAVDLFGPTGDFSLTIDGETLFFSAGKATDAAGRTWSAARNTFGKASATTAVFTYSYGGGSDAVDSEGVFVTGFETSSEVLAALTDTLRYDGTWFGYGAVVDSEGSLVESGVEGGGLISFQADMRDSSLSVDLTGSFLGFGAVAGDIPRVPIVSGGFSGDVQADCDGQTGCASATVLVGRFYGANADDISGLIAFDERRTVEGQPLVLIAPAGFTAERDALAVN